MKYRSKEIIDAEPYQYGMEDGFETRCGHESECLYRLHQYGLYINCECCKHRNDIKKIPYLYSNDFPPRHILIKENDFIAKDEDGWKSIISKETMKEDYELIEKADSL